MRRLVFYSLLLLLFIIIAYYFTLRITGYFIGFGPPQGNFEWWNVSWRYRLKIEINSSIYERNNWPIEIEINFTDFLPSGTFDENSTRVLEYDESGNILYEVPSQFDKSDNFNSSSNAIGTLIFLLNGTTQANQKRIFYVYYDVIENGGKEKPSYPTNLSYSWDGKEIIVNTSFSFYNIDTNRGENTSGFYKVKRITGDIIFLVQSEIDRTTEYIEYSNGSSLGFYLNNIDFIPGPIRLTIKQVGDETIFGNPNQKTNEGKMTKKYYFYDLAGPEEYGSFVKIEQNFTNVANYQIYRNSTKAGALAFDLNRSFHQGISDLEKNSSEPYSWVWASDPSGYLVGVLNLNETNTNNFFVENDTELGRIGVQLNETLINQNSWIYQKSLVYFGIGGASATTEFLDIVNRYSTPPQISISLPERLYVSLEPTTNATIYNRNESVLIKLNITDDPYNLTAYVNATLDMGTSSGSDDETLILYDDGTHGDEEAGDKVFSNTFDITNDASLGIWAINFTVYSENYEFLNFTIYNFNVTDLLNVNVEIQNKKPMIGSIVKANIYVKNYRQDSFIPGAEINCTYDSFEVENKTDYNNGTYSVNFTAPTEEGTYTLTCNVSKNGNFGNGTDTFTTEPGKTNVSLKIQPENPLVEGVTFYKGNSFEVNVNASNIGNGTAYSVNISLELINEWQANSSLEECGEIEKGSFCLRGFNISVPKATYPGNYSINFTATWINPDETIEFKKVSINVTVTSNPLVNVSEEKISGEAGDGISSIIGNFTVISAGNDNSENISFSCVSGDACNFIIKFIPENISSLLAGENQSVAINVSVPLGYDAGNYSGIVNVSAFNDGFDIFEIEVSVPSKTNVSINTSIPSFTAENITQTQSQNFSFQASIKNIGNGSARYSNISLTLPSGWNSNSTLENCENLVKNQECSKSFEVEIPKKTSPGNYYVYVRTNWTNLDNSLGTNQTSLLVNITSNPLVNVSEEKISGNIPDGSEAYLANFTVLSEGNDNLQNINFNCISGIVCQDFIIKFIPENISSLLAGENQSVAINVSVPLGYDAGNYSGIVNVSAFNDGFDIFEIEVSVPINRTWSMQPEICQKSQTPPEGIACEVNVSNLGNIYINFTISPEEGNYTKVNETNFTINARSSHTFSVSYNVTGIPPNIYNSTFIVSAVEEANPKNKSLIVTLLPYVEPIIEFKIIPNETQQKNSVEFFVNITDRSGTGISWTKLNITQPNSTLQTYDMIKTYESGNLSMWYLKYESGNTTQRGRYNVSIYTKDNVGNIGIKNSSFIIYYYLNIFLSTLSTKYYQGDQGSIYYNVKDLNGNGIENISVEFLIKDSLGNITHYSSYKTNSEGSIYPLPTFYISSDSPLGIYNLTSITSYHDEMVNETFYVYKSYNFEVLSRTVTVTGLFADIETAVVWYPDNTMKFGILTYNGEGRPVDVDFMNLTVYRPDGLVYFTDTLANMQRKMTGFYTYERSMSPDSPSGMYLAALNATQGEFQTLKLKAFRVARGGPYDLWVELLENEVKRGDYLDFVITIENKGEVSQDIFLEWWVSVGNETYYYESGWFYTPSLSNQTTTKQAYIFKTQPLGTSILTVRMTYDNIQSPLVANRTFIVLAEELMPPNITLPELPPPPITYVYPIYIPTAAAIIPPAKEVFAEIKIVSYRENISVVRGASRVESVVVKNAGETTLENVSFLVFGIPLEWYNVTPEFYRSLPPGNTSVFLITFNIPANAKLGTTRITLTALSGVVSDQKYATLTIFQSMEELLEDEIKKLKSDLALLEQDVKRAEAEGKDVSVLTSLLEDIRIQISLAEENLKNNKLEDAFDNVRRARNLIDKAKDLLSKLEVKKAIFRPIIPIWLIPLLILLILLPILLFLTRKKIPALRPYIIPVGRVAERVKKEEKKEEIVREREKLLRMLEVLEKEKEEGIISIAAYKEMKKNIEDKLKNIEKKLK